ncbi:MAG: MBL fold metallo-hydrolase [Verrucomicrobiota bacterium]|nr:MBL fold metallo-hydrolase [Limisphaera sp.]MDW8381174.1 MBL fold metallo-hydrolase [Verrucomicrobiota bacterium]
MTLEDHLGDIVRKARAMSGVRVEDAARVAGLSEAEFEVFEETGEMPRGVNWRALALRVGLNADKLQSLVNGWRPQVPLLSRWQMLRCFTTEEAGNRVNAYLIWDLATLEAALFDTGWDASEVLEVVREHGLQLRYLFVTHAHADHVTAMGMLQGALGELEVRAHPMPAPRDLPGEEGLPVGRLRIWFRPTPGHAPDGVTYVVRGWPGDAPPVAIVGDAIFAGSIGRGNQSWELAQQAVRDQILSLPPDTLLCPGHGPMTTVAEEQAHNPFF